MQNPGMTLEVGIRSEVKHRNEADSRLTARGILMDLMWIFVF